jgi:DNA-binding protein H-NS
MRSKQGQNRLIEIGNIIFNEKNVPSQGNLVAQYTLNWLIKLLSQFKYEEEFLSMALQNTIKSMRALLGAVTSDLDKAENGNKAASQRVRTGTVRLEKIAKLYRKESITSEKGKGGSRKPAKKAKPAPKAAAAKPKAKAAAGKARKTTAKSRPLSIKRATAKLPTRANWF